MHQVQTLKVKVFGHGGSCGSAPVDLGVAAGVAEAGLSVAV